MASAQESGQAFLASVIAKLPAELQAAAKEIFGKPEAKDAIVLVGDGALARTDYSKQMDELTARQRDLDTKLANLDNWFSDNKAALDEYVVIKPEYDTLKAAGGGKGLEKKEPEVVDPRKVAEEVLAQNGRDYVQLSAWIAAKSVEHLHAFNEPLDVLALVNDPRLGKPVQGQPGRVVSLPDLYQEKYGGRIAEKTKAAEDARIKAEVDKQVQAELAKRTTQPFPLRSDPQPSVLDTLGDAPKHTLDSAVAFYDQLQQARGT